MSQEKYTIFWFRRDLRLDDNIGFYRALRLQLILDDFEGGIVLLSNMLN